uniref:Uncharacterized protein n=1 Tax=Panagrolaimus sp. PS1159 TaxID=55785 RepID=A0AC35FWM3_9BILA
MDDIKAVEESMGIDEDEELPPKKIPTFLKDEEDKLPLLTSYKYNMFVHDHVDFAHRAFLFKAKKVFEAKLEKLCRLRTKDEIQRKKLGLKKDVQKDEERKKELFDIYVQLGHIHLLSGDFPKSMFAYQHAYKYDSAKFRSNPPALFGIGLVYFHFKAHAA